MTIGTIGTGLLYNRSSWISRALLNAKYSYGNPIMFLAKTSHAKNEVLSHVLVKFALHVAVHCTTHRHLVRSKTGEYTPMPWDDTRNSLRALRHPPIITRSTGHYVRPSSRPLPLVSMRRSLCILQNQFTRVPEPLRDPSAPVCLLYSSLLYVLPTFTLIFTKFYSR